MNTCWSKRERERHQCQHRLAAENTGSHGSLCKTQDVFYALLVSRIEDEETRFFCNALLVSMLNENAYGFELQIGSDDVELLSHKNEQSAGIRYARALLSLYLAQNYTS